MVILFRSSGNHSNRLLQAVHIEAFCMENRIKFKNMCFHDLCKFYGMKSFPFSPFLCLVMKLLSRLRIVPTQEFSDPSYNESYKERMRSCRLLLVEGWCFRVPNLVTKYHSYITRKYSLLPDYYRENDLYALVMHLKKEKFIIVGIHIRRGDYKNWKNGRYYFENRVYERCMDNIRAQLTLNGIPGIKFVLFSNEENLEISEKEDTIVSRNPWYIDHLIMSNCDYLIGPPSTFTIWASYYGRVKYLHIEDEFQNICIEQFHQHIY